MELKPKKQVVNQLIVDLVELGQGCSGRRVSANSKVEVKQNIKLALAHQRKKLSHSKQDCK